MINLKAYFKSHLRSNLRSMIYILVIALALTFIIGVSLQPQLEFNDDYVLVTDYNSTLFVPVTILCILCYVTPVMQFSFFKKRRNLDCAYSLPISRIAMGTVHYLTGLITTLGTFTASYAINFIMLLSRGGGYFDFRSLPLHFLLCLLIGFSMYSLLTFVFNEGNTAKDGKWFMGLWTFVFWFLASGINCVKEMITGDFYPRVSEHVQNGIPWGHLNEITTIYQRVIEKKSGSIYDFWGDTELVIWLAFWILIGIAATVLFFLSFGKRRTESTEEISESFFGYRVMIPIYAALGMILSGAFSTVVFWVIIELLALVGYTIYRRGFHYKKSDIIVLAALAIFLFMK